MSSYPQFSFPDRPCVLVVSDIAGKAGSNVEYRDEWGNWVVVKSNGRAYITVAPMRVNVIFQNLTKTKFTIPAGFVLDGASVPRIAQSICPSESLLGAAVVHDWLYAKCNQCEVDYLADCGDIHPRKFANLAFRSYIRQRTGIGRVREWLAYCGVRTFGGHYFRELDSDFFRTYIAKKLGGVALKYVKRGIWTNDKAAAAQLFEEICYGGK